MVFMFFHGIKNRTNLKDKICPYGYLHQRDDVFGGLFVCVHDKFKTDECMFSKFFFIWVAPNQRKK